jgi:hypothetical protein
VKHDWIKWIVMMVTLISLFQDHQLILTPLDTLPSKDVLILYYKEGCPYANQVHTLLIESIDSHAKWKLATRQSTSYFPSPTLRIPVEDFYMNYIGAKAIKEAIKTMIFS